MVHRWFKVQATLEALNDARHKFFWGCWLPKNNRTGCSAPLTSLTSSLVCNAMHVHVPFYTSHGMDDSQWLRAINFICLFALRATCFQEFFFYSAPWVFASANFVVPCFPFLPAAFTLEHMLLHIRFIFVMLRFLCWRSLSCLFTYFPSTSNCNFSTLAMVEQLGRPPN